MSMFWLFWGTIFTAMACGYAHTEKWELAIGCTVGLVWSLTLFHLQRKDNAPD